jgi:6-pyruvoyltetrahydropterin/6-carboxytetrahydropterin synthase
MILITKTFRFEMAHALDNHDGKCRNLHGHSYQLNVTLTGTVIDDDSHHKAGMIMDFGDLKRLVKEEILDRFDHGLLLWEKSPFLSENSSLTHSKLIKVSWHPTSENMVQHFAELIRPRLPEGVELHHLDLFETPSSSASWYNNE